MSAALGRVGKVEKRGGLDGPHGGRLLQDPLGGLDSAGQNQRAPVQRQRVARRVRTCRCGLERLNRFRQRDGIVMCFRGREPDTSQRLVDDVGLRVAFSGSSKRGDRGVGSTHPCVGEADVDEALGPGWFERGERFELLDAFTRLALRQVQRSQLLSCHSERWIQLQRTPKRRHRFWGVLLSLQTQGEQVVRFGESIVERDRLPDRINRQRELPTAIVGKAELVEDLRCAIVNRKVAAIDLDGAFVSAHRGVDVAQQFECARRSRVESRRFAKVAERCGQFTAAAIAVSALEVREHRIALQGESATECLNRFVRLVAGEGCVAGGNQAPEFTLLADRIPGKHRPGEQNRSGNRGHSPACHRFQNRNTLRIGGTFPDLSGSNPPKPLVPRSLFLYTRMTNSGSGALVKNAGAISWSEVDSREAALIERCVAGDEAACADLVAAHQRTVFNLAFHLLGDRDEALDVSQEVFLRVFRTLSRFRGQSALRTWIYRIVVNQVSNRQRWWRRRRRADLISLDDHLKHCGELEATREVLPDRLLASKETATRIWAAMERLPFDQRTALVLREIDGLRYEEIAFTLDVAVGTVKSRLTRARQALREELLGMRS